LSFFVGGNAVIEQAKLVLSLNELHGQLNLLLLAESKLIDQDDIGMIEASGEQGFLDELLKLSRCHVSRRCLHRNIPLEALLNSLIDKPHAASSNNISGL
jgi:hypothetical protein